MNKDTPDPAGRVLYDDSRGFCRLWAPFWEKTLQVCKKYFFHFWLV